jgi:hypothetical protein
MDCELAGIVGALTAGDTPKVVKEPKTYKGDCNHMGVSQDQIAAVNNAKADLMEVADRLPAQFAETLRGIVDDLADLIDDLEG